MPGSDVAITVTISPPTSPGGRVLALAEVSIGLGGCVVTTRFWRVTDFGSGRPRIYPPSKKIDDAWIDSVSLDPGLLGKVADAVLEAYARQRYPEAGVAV